LEAHKANVKTALDLVSRLLEPESTKRITPRQALRHAFLREDDALDDDDLAPHLFGKGVCGKLHFIDEELERPCVKVSVVRDGRTVWRVRPISAGEGVAFGKNPCEFHAGMVQTDS
jgi:cell division control protein 7